jgi:hypothetical protein
MTSDWDRRIAVLDARLHPIANGTAPGAAAPLDELGVRIETEALLGEIIDAYRIADGAGRDAIRQLWTRHRSFAWAATLPFTPLSAERFRDHVALFSIADQGRDTRDAILALAALCDAARTAGVAIEAALREGVELSSDIDRYGMGSTRSLFERHVS